MNKKLIWIGAAIAVIGICGYLYNQNNEEFKLITNDEELAEFMQDMDEGDLEEYLAKKDELYSRDLYGGETPEETLDLYIEALNIGDLVLASKYFKLEDQEKELDRLANLETSSLSNYIDMLSSYTKSYCDEENVKCNINGVYRDIDILVSRLILNQQTDKWKMESIGN